MSIYRRVTDEEIEKALIQNDYQISETSRVLGFTRVSYLKRRIANNPNLSKLVEGKTQYRREITRVSEEDFIEAIYEGRGNRNAIARLLGLDISTVAKRVRNNPELQDHLKKASEYQKDVAELKLFELVEQGNLDAIKFYLSRQARDRGYGDRMDLSADMNMVRIWNLEVLGMEELKLLEQMARKALPEA
jgi:hypothetical protein